MIGLERLGRGRWRAAIAWVALALAMGEPSASAGGGWGYGRGNHWGEYGLGPHVRRPHHGGPIPDGYPYFTHPMACGVPFVGYVGDGRAGLPFYGPYTGAPPALVRWPDPLSTPPSARRRALPTDVDPPVTNDLPDTSP